MLNYIVIAVVAYLIGSISFSIIFTKKFAGFDVREKGSGNAGSTNVLRTAGKIPALLTLICDTLKGVVGHTFPIFFGFKGGKGVATALGVLLITNWRIGLICLVFALIIMAVFKMVSLGSIAAAILFPVLCLFTKTGYIVGDENAHMTYVIFAIVLACIVIFNHRSNLNRLIHGTENKLKF